MSIWTRSPALRQFEACRLDQKRSNCMHEYRCEVSLKLNPWVQVVAWGPIPESDETDPRSQEPMASRLA